MQTMTPGERSFKVHSARPALRRARLRAPTPERILSPHYEAP